MSGCRHGFHTLWGTNDSLWQAVVLCLPVAVVWKWTCHVSRCVWAKMVRSQAEQEEKAFGSSSGTPFLPGSPEVEVRVECVGIQE